MTIIYFILILGITVFIHELGHFMFAKKFGVHVYEFSLGMGPKLFKFNRKNDETNYCIRLFPVGGFVQMAGEELDVDENIPEDKSLQSKPAYQRFIIMIAGVMMNFLLAIVLFFFIALFNKVSLNNVYVTNSQVSGLENGTKIISINDKFINNYDKLALEMTVAGNKNFTVTVKDSNNNTKNVDIKPIPIGKSNLIYGYDYGFTVKNKARKDNKSVLIISETNNNELLKDAQILKINGEKITDYAKLLKILSLKENSKVINLTILDNNNNEKIVPINIKENDSDELLGYSYGFYITGKQETGFITAIKYSFYKFFSTIEQMFFTILYLITGKISLGMLSGPVGIYNVVSIYSSYGFANLLSLLCLICINVGFINILPLPAFDGGHVLFVIIEKIKGSKVNPKIENIVHNIGFILLMILMVLITYNDIIKLFK